jgi:hypothetical protein
MFSLLLSFSIYIQKLKAKSSLLKHRPRFWILNMCTPPGLHVTSWRDQTKASLNIRLFNSWNILQHQSFFFFSFDVISKFPHFQGFKLLQMSYGFTHLEVPQCLYWPLLPSCFHPLLNLHFMNFPWEVFLLHKSCFNFFFLLRKLVFSL